MKKYANIKNEKYLHNQGIKAKINKIKKCPNTPSDLIAWVRFPLPAPISKIVAPDEND